VFAARIIIVSPRYAYVSSILWFSSIIAPIIATRPVLEVWYVKYAAAKKAVIMNAMNPSKLFLVYFSFTIEFADYCRELSPAASVMITAQRCCWQQEYRRYDSEAKICSFIREVFFVVLSFKVVSML